MTALRQGTERAAAFTIVEGKFIAVFYYQTHPHSFEFRVPFVFLRAELLRQVETWTQSPSIIAFSLAAAHPPDVGQKADSSDLV